MMLTEGNVMQVVTTLAVTALLGLIVSLSTFLALGAVSSVTFNGKLPSPPSPSQACMHEITLKNLKCKILKQNTKRPVSCLWWSNPEDA